MRNYLPRSQAVWGVGSKIRMTAAVEAAPATFAKNSLSGGSCINVLNL